MDIFQALCAPLLGVFMVWVYWGSPAKHNKKSRTVKVMLEYLIVKKKLDAPMHKYFVSGKL
jgi:hypothetical protein